MGGVAIITSALCATMSGCGHDKADTESIASVEGTTICHTTTTRENTTTAKQITNTTTVQVESTTTTMAVTTTMMTQLEMMTTTIEEAVDEVVEVELTTVSNEQSEGETEMPEITTETYTSNLPIAEYERILLCNLVGREYGSDYVSVYDKACVVAVVMNRVNSPQFPNTIYEVLTQPYQFSGYFASDSYSYQVTDSVIESVDYYFSHQEEFGNWFYFEGDGTYNYFR
jgi:spore germination cell wall hydrolase CwlJ-like protein